jgi:L-rhamnonate dehydratase
MAMPTVAHLRAFVPQAPSLGAASGNVKNWIDDHVASPMSRYPQYRESREGWGHRLIGQVVVVVESSDGKTGIAVTAGGELAAWIIENHLARFVEGARVCDLERIWDQMYHGTLAYGRKGVVLFAISGVDLALWDLLGQIRQEPVFAMLGGAVREAIPCYATGSRPDLAKQMGFIGGKLPLHWSAAEGEDGLQRNLALLSEMRDRVGADFWLMYDCWMSLDLPYATRLAHRAAEHGLRWIEEALPPDDYWGYAALRRAVPPGMLVTTGEHEATRWGFRLLLEMGCADVIQPDVGWCGGLTELIKIGNLAAAHNVELIPHCSGVYSYHFVLTRTNSPYAEFLMRAPGADEVRPMLAPVLLDEPLPVDGCIRLSDAPGFGVRLNPDCVLARPFARQAR